MSVYVDPEFACKPSRDWKWNRASHLFADSVLDLHRFARRLGLLRAWFQHRPGKLPHYDLTPSRRMEAIRLGVVQLDRAAAVEKWAELKATGQFIDPEVTARAAAIVTPPKIPLGKLRTVAGEILTRDFAAIRQDNPSMGAEEILREILAEHAPSANEDAARWRVWQAAVVQFTEYLRATGRLDPDSSVMIIVNDGTPIADF